MGNTTKGIGTGEAIQARSRPQGRRQLAVAAAALLAVLPGVARAQGVDLLPAGTRVRADLPGSEHTFLGHRPSQPVVGTLLGIHGDTLLLEVRPGAEPLRVPRGTLAGLQRSEGRRSRLESAARRALLPTIASAALGALAAHLGRGDDSPGEAAWKAAQRTASFTAAIGFLSPGERWQRVPLPPVPPGADAGVILAGAVAHWDTTIRGRQP
jgi:hypothetical protein